MNIGFVLLAQNQMCIYTHCDIYQLSDRFFCINHNMDYKNKYIFTKYLKEDEGFIASPVCPVDVEGMFAESHDGSCPSSYPSVSPAAMPP